MLRGWSTCLLASRIIQKGLQQTDINTGSKTVELSRFRTHVAPVVMEASCDETGKAPEGVLFTEMRMPVETHLMSNVSLGRAALSHMPHGKTACALFHGLLSRAISSVALTISPLWQESD